MTAKIRVLNLCSNRWNSAITEYSLSVGRALQIADYDVLNVGLTDSPFLSRAQSYGLATEDISSFGMGQVLRLKSIINKFSPSIIFSSGGPETLLSGVAAMGQIAQIRIRGYGLDSSVPSFALTHDLGQIGVRLLIAPSKSIADKMRKITRIPVTDLTLGVDENVFKFSYDSFIEPPKASLLIFGRFDPVKGHREFMKLFSQAKKEIPFPTCLRIVGNPANVSLSHLQKYCEEASLVWNQDVVVECGRVADVSHLLQNATLGVIPSLGSEAICRVAEEFLLCGTPIIVSGAGSLDDVLEHDSFGRSYFNLSPDETIKLICSSVISAFNESNLERKQRSEIALAKFSIARMSKDLDLIVQSVLSA